MQVEHVIVSSEEATRIKPPGDLPYGLLGEDYSHVPRWAVVVFSLAAALLPLLCVLTIVSRIVLRSEPLPVRYAWADFFSSLLTVSGVFASLAAVVFLSLPRMPVVLSTSIPDFDERDTYPRLPYWGTLESADVSIELKPLVIIVSPISQHWNGQPTSSDGVGAGVLLLANKQGYLFATAKHLIVLDGKTQQRALVSTASGMRASADVVASADHADLALLWLNRRSGSAAFAQPLGDPKDGESIFVIGHPEGFNYTLSAGIVSGLRGLDVQITAPISPGNSGGPVYDVHGNLVGIVSSKFDQTRDANGENLGFAITGELLQQTPGWQFAGDGALRLQQYTQALHGG